MKPWKSDFVLFKQESPFDVKLDLNEAIAQGADFWFSISNKIDVNLKLKQAEIIINNLNNQLKHNQKTIELLIKEKQQNTSSFISFANDLFSFNSSLSIFAVCSFAVALIFIVKYFRLNKNFNKAIKINTLASKNSHLLINSLKSHKKNYDDLIKSEKDLNVTLNNLALKIKKDSIISLQLKKNEWIEKIKINNKNITKENLFTTSIARTVLKGKIKEKSPILAHISSLNLYKKLKESQTFPNNKENPSFLIFSCASLLLFYYIIELGLTDPIKDGFLLKINEENFPSNSESSGLSIKDFDIPNRELIFKTYNIDSYIDKGHKESLMLIKNVYKI